jgi:N6-adenosine-specific RNA methylase IME4
VERDVRRASKIPQDVRDDIRDIESIADSGVELDALASMPEEEQREAVALVKSGEAKSVRKAQDKVKRKKRKASVASLKAEKPKTYNVILADPPWSYSNTGTNAAAKKHYDTMPTSDLCEFLQRIEVEVQENSVLFMWVTNPLIIDALSVIDSWGFNYKTNLVWVKTELTHPGVGWYVRGDHELLFIATRGSFTPLEKLCLSSVLHSPKREHSRKPEEVYEIIESLYPGCSYLEIFARTEREGWDCYGNQTDTF